MYHQWEPNAGYSGPPAAMPQYPNEQQNQAQYHQQPPPSYAGVPSQCEPQLTQPHLVHSSQVLPAHTAMQATTGLYPGQLLQMPTQNPAAPPMVFPTVSGGPSQFVFLSQIPSVPFDSMRQIPHQPALLPEPPTKASPPPVCRHFLEGKCNRRKCRFSHQFAPHSMPSGATACPGQSRQAPDPAS